MSVKNLLPLKKLIACDPLIGEPKKPLYDFTPDVADLMAKMEKLHVERAIVRHVSSLFDASYACNDFLMEDLSACEALMPACFVTPDGRGPEFDAEKLIDAMVNAGLKFAWTNPGTANYLFLPWCCEKLFNSLQNRQLPLILDQPFTPNNLDHLHQTLSAFPEMKIVLTRLTRTGRHRVLEALLERHSNIYLCFNHTFSVHAGFADICRRYGAKRWVWGMGYPDAEVGASLTGLLYSGLAQEQLEAVAYQNMERLIEEVD